MLFTLQKTLKLINNRYKGSGKDTVDKAVVDDTEGPGLESTHWLLVENNYLLIY